MRLSVRVISSTISGSATIYPREVLVTIYVSCFSFLAQVGNREEGGCQSQK